MSAVPPTVTLEEALECFEKAELALFREQEQRYVDAASKLIACYWDQQKSSGRKKVYELIEKCYDHIFNGAKDRQRTGNAIYRLSGIFSKQGGSYKSWKERYFVVDDTAITYYKDKKEWENGPVKGVPSKSQGVIEFNTITGITKCGTMVCQNEHVKHDSRPKKGTHCLHIAITEGRTYNMVGFDKDTLDEWIKVLKLAINIYQFKKTLKKWIKENADIKATKEKEINNDDKRKEKKKVMINSGETEDPKENKDTTKPDSPRKTTKPDSPRKTSKPDSPRKSSKSERKASKASKSETPSTESQNTPNVEVSSQSSANAESTVKDQSKDDRAEPKSSNDQKSSDKVTKSTSSSDLKSTLKSEDETLTVKQSRRKFRSIDDNKAEQVLKQLMDALYNSNQIRECFLYFIHLEEELGHSAKEFMLDMARDDIAQKQFDILGKLYQIMKEDNN